jgi:hypothetical protein
MNSNKTRVTLEDLLRVKRSEQPPSTFWPDFERELRAKQLAAIVEPRPWWAPFIRVGSKASRLQLPAGAAAILALSLATVGQYRTASVRPLYRPQTAVVSSAPSAVAPALPETVVDSRVASNEGGANVNLSTDDSVDYADSLASPGAMSHAAPLVEAVQQAEPTPSARYIAANLAAAQAADPGLMDVVFRTAARRVEARQPVRDPLAQIADPGESRRSRLMESALPANGNSGEVAIGTSARVARRLTEDRLYDTIRRIGVQGDRVAIKF